MLAKPGPIPQRTGWLYEVKWDGFRAVLGRQADGFRVRSRRGWDMTALLPELACFPAEGIFDGEIVCFQEGRPHFPDVVARMLHGRPGISISYVIFDVLYLDGQDTTRLPLRERRALLDGLGVETGDHWTLSQAFDDGANLFQACCDQEMEGIVCKRLDENYRPGERRWIKAKNRDYWRYPSEVALARSRRYKKLTI